jgi:hypothetical protein
MIVRHMLGSFLSNRLDGTGTADHASRDGSPPPETPGPSDRPGPARSRSRQIRPARGHRATEDQMAAACSGSRQDASAGEPGDDTATPLPGGDPGAMAAGVPRRAAPDLGAAAVAGIAAARLPSPPRRACCRQRTGRECHRALGQRARRLVHRRGHDAWAGGASRGHRSGRPRQATGDHRPRRRNRPGPAPGHRPVRADRRDWRPARPPGLGRYQMGPPRRHPRSRDP